MNRIPTEAEQVDLLRQIAEEAVRNAHDAVSNYHRAAIAADPIKVNSYIVSSWGDVARVDDATCDDQGVVRHVIRLRTEDGQYRRHLADRFRACWRDPVGFATEREALAYASLLVSASREKRRHAEESARKREAAKGRRK